MPSRCRVANIEYGLPTVEEARKRLTEEIRRATQAGVEVLKVIHGYRSSGIGGSLRENLRRFLISRRKDKIIQARVWAEKWDIFDQTTRHILEVCPEVRKDRDLGMGNPGITIVLLSASDV
jgi:hypothetical protein